MRNITRAREKQNLEPPMTPMIDIIFNLLIFFILTPSFSAEEGYLTTNLPKTSGPVAGKAQKDVPSIKITLFSETPPDWKEVSVVLNETESFGANFGALEERLLELRNDLPPDHPVLISPDMAVRHRWVVQAFDAAVAARFTDIRFAVPR